MNIFLPAFIIGLAGSLHCVGMCSPLVLAAGKAGKGSVMRNVVYNLGRIVTYGIMGALISFAGAGFKWLGYQQWISIIVGIVLLVIGVFNVSLRLPGFVAKPIVKLIVFLKTRFSAVLVLGMINGLLPCGLTLAGLAYCAALDTPTDGFLAMLFFGVGTLPAMSGMVFITKSVIARLNFRYQTIQAIFLILSAVLLIARGSITAHAEHKSEEITECVTAPRSSE